MKRFQIVVECDELPEWIYDSVLANAPVHEVKVVGYDEIKEIKPSDLSDEEIEELKQIEKEDIEFDGCGA